MVNAPRSSSAMRPPRTSSSSARKVATLVLRLWLRENSCSIFATVPPSIRRRMYTTRLVTDTMGAVTSGSNCCCVGSLRSLVRPESAAQ